MEKFWMLRLYLKPKYGRVQFRDEFPSDEETALSLVKRGQKYELFYGDDSDITVVKTNLNN